MRVDKTHRVRRARAGLLRWALYATIGAISAAQKYYNSSLEFESPRAGEVATITVRFAPFQATVPAGTRIPLTLKGFSKCNTDCLDYVKVDGNQFSSQGLWTETNSTLLLTVSSDLQGNRQVKAIVQSNEGIRLPSEGLDPFSREITLCPEATDCDINSIPAVGSFLHPTVPVELRYSQTPPLYTPSQAGRNTEVLTIRFWNNMRFLQGDQIVLTLTDFSATEFSELRVIDSDYEWSASWSSETRQLTFQYMGSTPINSRLNVLPVENKIAVASNGVVQNDPSLLISSNAQNGPVLPTAIQISPFVTGLILDSEVGFVRRRCRFNGFQWVCVKSLARAGEAAEVRFVFSLSIPVARNEQIILYLPNVEGPDLAVIPITDGSTFGDDALGQSLVDTHPYGCRTESQCAGLSYGGTGLFRRASWSSASQELALTSLSAVAQFTELVVVVPIAAGLRLPSVGVRLNDRAFSMRGTLAAGPMPGGPIQAVNPVGKLEQLRLEFDPPVPGANATLVVQFSAKMVLTPGDVLSLSLPRFQGKSGSVAMPDDPFISAASWARDGEQLQLTVGVQVSPDTLIRAVVPSESGLVLPSSGIVGADSGVQYTLAAAEGPVPEGDWTEVQDIPNLLDQTRVTYGAADGIGPTSLNFSFVTSARVERGIVQLFLPEFPEPILRRPTFAVTTYRQTGRRAGTEERTDHFVEGSWNTTGPSLQFELAMPIDNAQQMTIHVPASVGVTLPALGSDGLGVSSVVRGIQDLSNRVLFSPAIAPAFSHVRVQFRNPKPEVAVPISLSFTVDSPAGLAPGDEIVFGLRGWFTVDEPRELPFRGFESEYDVTLLSQQPPTAVTDAKWTAFGNDLTLTVDTALAASASVQVVLDPASAPILIPEAGVRVLDHSLSFGGVVGGLAVLPSPVSYVQPVGAFPQSPSLAFSNPRAGEVTAVTLTLSAFMPLEAGDTVTVNMTGFEGRSSTGIVTSLVGLIPTASWNNQTGQLIFTAGALVPIPALTQMTVEIGAEWGVRVPPEGILRAQTCADPPHSDCPITVSVRSPQFGSILPLARTPVHDYTPIGRFLRSALLAEPRVAGRPSTLTIEFTFVFKITAGDEVRVFLDEFEVADDLGVGPVVSDGVFVDMGWQVSRGGVIVRLLAQSDAPPRTPQSFTIPQSTEIRTPELGVTPDNVGRMTISINALEGIVLDTPLLQTPSIGAFTQLNVALDPASAGAISEMTFQITASMDILAGERVNITLQGFTGAAQSTVLPDTLILNETSGEYYSVGWFPSGEWSLASEVITMRSVVDIPLRTAFRLVIPREAGIAIPAGGLATSFEVMRIGVEASRGWIDPYPVPLAIRTVPAVLRNTLFTAFPPLAGSVVQLDIRIQSRLKLNQGATIELVLPDFYDGQQCWLAAATEEEIERRCLPQQDLSQDDLEYRFCDPVDPTINSFQQRFRGGCKFTPMVRLGTHREVRQSVGSCDCLDSPSDSAAQRNTWAVKFPSKPPLPQDYGRSCAAWDNTEEAPCDALWEETGPHCCSSWCFVGPTCPTSIPWEVNESVAFSYDTCQDDVDKVAACEFNSPPEGLPDIATASWSPNGGRLVLTIEKPIQAFTPFTVMVPASANIRLPLRGLRLNQETLTVDLLDGLSRMPPSAIERTEAVGSFTNTQLASSSSIVGRPTRLTLQFVPTMPLRVGTSISAMLPSFSARRSSVAVLARPGGAFLNATWTQATRTLLLPVERLIEADTLVQVTIPDGVVSIPAQGLRGGLSEGVLLFTDAIDGPVSELFPTRVTDVPVIGSLLNTAVHLDPLAANTALRFTIDFTLQMPLAAGESVTLALPQGFTGPRAIALIMNTESVQPADAFEAFWSFDDTPLAPPQTVNDTWWRGQPDYDPNAITTLPAMTFTALTVPVAAGTHCRIVIAATCVFLVDRKCSDAYAPIVWTRASDYDPLLLTLSSDAVGGEIPPTPVRLSSVLASTPIAALNGSWEGDLHTNVAALDEAGRSHLMSCLSVAYQCPSTSGYRCFSLNLPASLDIAGSQGRLEVAPRGKLIPDLNKAYQLGQLSASLALDTFSGNQLSMRNLTGGGTSLCAYARPMHRVNLLGDHDTAMELLVPFVFQATRQLLCLAARVRDMDTEVSLSDGSSIEYHIRLRVALSADPEFNPFGFEMVSVGERAKLRRAIAATTKVSEDRVTFMSYLPQYPPIERCQDTSACNLEVRIEADTEEQKQNGDVWSAQIAVDIEAGVLRTQMWQEDLIASASLREPLFSSPKTEPDQACPRPPQGRLSPVDAEWTSGTGDEVDRSEFGFASDTSSTCRQRLGAANGDEIDYDDAYTLNFEIIGLLVKQNRPVDLSRFQGMQAIASEAVGGDGESVGAAGAVSLAARTQTHSHSALMLWVLFTSIVLAKMT